MRGKPGIQSRRISLADAIVNPPDPFVFVDLTPIEIHHHVAQSDQLDGIEIVADDSGGFRGVAEIEDEALEIPIILLQDLGAVISEPLRPRIRSGKMRLHYETKFLPSNHIVAQRVEILVRESDNLIRNWSDIGFKSPEEATNVAGWRCPLTNLLHDVLGKGLVAVDKLRTACVPHDL